MKSCNGSLSLVLLLSHLLVVSVTLTAAGHICYTTGNFTTNSTYGQNRDDILLSLSSSITVTNGGFYTATLGQGSGKVYALALCGGEVKVTVETCKNCVSFIAENIINTCPNQKEAFMWGDGGVPTCVVRYSNRSIFGVKEVKPFLALYATADLSSNMSGIDEIWSSFMSTVVTKAAMGSSKLKFASKEKNLTGSEKIYAWGQCTPDLSQSDCGECLQESLSYFRSCCIGHGGIVYRPSCMMRSDAYPIYDYTTSSPAPLPAPPPPSTNTTTGRGAPICYPTGNFTTNSKYGQNRNDILLSLSSNIIATNVGFYKATLGQGSDKVYALALCGGDYVLHAETCSFCVDSIARTIKDNCPNQKESIMWADGRHNGVPACIVRYSNRSIFGVKEVNPYVIYNTTGNISSNMDGIDEIWNSFMSTIVTEAAMGSSKLKFSSKVKNLTGFEKIYGLAQCTPDLSQSDCRECLEECLSSFQKCCIGHGGIVYRPSCLIRSESYPIYESYATASFPAPSLPSTNTTFSSPAPPPSSPNTTILTGGGYSSRRIIIIVVATVISVVVFFTFCLCFIRWKARKKDETIKEENVENEITTVQSLQFELGIIEAATNNFSADNKIGEGGFGSVYKGTLSNEQEIAVKRLSSGSGQGAQEFKNEVVLVAKLQHRNLVRLLGFCMGGEEKILIYEFVPNKSLDYFLFDPKKQAQLDWLRRYKIIGGIARGMLYLHVDSRLRIIHRDLKASNVLLDENMDPKISDFGLARNVGVDQTRGITNRIVGTYGYMAPEYLIRGHFSTKSDVFSFGVLVLEIISGKKNNSFYQSDYDEDLLSYAWKHWRDGTPLELMDPTLTESYSKNEVIRCVQIGLLCVQQDPADRPTMASIVLMLDSFLVSLPLPQQPAFFAHSRTESYMSVSKLVPSSVNEASITELYPR